MFGLCWSVSLITLPTPLELLTPYQKKKKMQMTTPWRKGNGVLTLEMVTPSAPFLLDGKQHLISDFTTQESTKLQSIPMEKIPVKLVLTYKKVNFIAQIDLLD